ncbi:MAG: Calx-beta domain-containing protein [Candidatus Marithrix sp.]
MFYKSICYSLFIILLIPIVYAADITVDTTDDELNSDGDCSLREAIETANTDNSIDNCTAGSGTDTINILAGEYTLTIPGDNEDDNATGDLDIKSDLTIEGAGAGITIIQAGTTNTDGIDRVLHIKNGTVNIKYITVRYGLADNSNDINDRGAGIYNDDILIIYSSSFYENNAGDNGGAIFNTGNLTINNSTIYNNTADGFGGGIQGASGGSITLNNSTIYGNESTNRGGGMRIVGGSLTVNNTIVAGNTSTEGNDCRNDISGTWNNSIVTDTNNNCNGTLVNNISTVLDTTDLTSNGIIDSGSNGIIDTIEINGTITLLPGSTDAIDAGSNCESIDQRNVNRPVDGDGDGNSDCDIGAVEYSPPTIDTNAGISVERGDTVIITSSELAVSDAEDTDANTLIFTITAIPSNGTLKNDTATLSDDDTFTQQVITDDEFNYVHNGGSDTSDSFTFTVHDSYNDITTGKTFDITIDDNPAPEFNSGYPQSSNIGQTSFDLTVQLNETGTVYYVVLTDGATAPTNAETQAGTGSGGSSEINGSITVGTADTDISETISSLDINTEYNIYLVAEDDLYNLQNSVTLLEVGTALNTYTLTTDTVGNGTVDGGGTFEENSDITLTANADSDSAFSSWSGDCSGSSASITVALTSDLSCTANFAIAYTLTVQSSGSGTVSGGGTYADGSTASISANPSSGYEFSSWSTGCSSSFTITGDKTCTATFTKKDTAPPTPTEPPLPQTMKLFVELAGSGTGVFELSPSPKEKLCATDEPEKCQYLYNTATRVTITAIADKNSIFEYWSGNSSCRKGSQTETGGEVDIYLISSLTCNLNFKLKPQKLMLNYEGEGNGTVKVSPDRGTETSCSQDRCIIFDGTKDITLTPEPDPYSQFDEWTGHEDCIDDSEIAQLELTSNKLCNAHFSLLPTYQVTVNNTGSGIGTIVQEPTGKNCEADTCEYAEGNEVILTAQPDAISSTFAGWNEDCGNGYLTITTDTACTATFMQKPTYQMSLQTNGDGNITVTPPPPIDGKYFEGQIVTLIPELGVNTKGVAFIGDCDSDKIVMNSDKSCLVKFTEQETQPVDPLEPYTLHLIIDGANGTILINTISEQTVCNGYCANNYAGNSLISLMIQPNPNARFTGWSKDCIGGQIIMDATKACTATFAPIYTLTIAKQGTGNGTITSDSGINCGEHCQTAHEIADLVNLTITPDPDSTFIGWNSSCIDGQVTINSSKICTATFTAKPAYKLTVAIEGVGKGKIESNPIGINCGITCEANFLQEEVPTVVQLIPYASPGSIFKNWSCDEEIDSGIKAVVMDGDKHCTAVFDSYGTIQFAENISLEVNEEANSISLPVNRLDGVLGEVSVAYKTTNAGATSEDYITQQGTLTWLADQNNTQFITIPILADKLAEPDETFIVTLLEPTGNAVLGTPHQLEITINDVPWQSYIQFAMLEYEVNESEGMIRLIATRAGSSKWPIEVAIRTENGTATEDDYQMLENILTWASGDMEPKYVDINIIQDVLEETKEYFFIAIDKIADKTEGLQLDPDKIVAVVTIFDTPPTGSLEFDRNSYDVRETETNIEVQVNRVGGVSGDISVQYATQAGTYLDAAKVNQDFAATAGTLTWTDGETTAKTILIPILLDNVKENSELFVVELSQPTGGSALGVQNTTIIEIADMTGASPSSGDDEINYPGILQFSKTDYTVQEGDDEAIITVERVGGQHGEVKVQYQTQDDLTDIVDIIYESTSGELVWADGDSEAKYFIINLFDNDFIGTDHVVQVKLFDATGGTIIERDETIVNIQDDDKAVFVLSADAYANYEGKEVIIGIYRQGNNLISKVSLDYEVKANTAVVEEDYTVIAKTLVWESGDVTKKEVKIPLIFDRLEEGNETFYFNLTEASNSATIGLPNTAVVTIVETDPEDCKPVPTSNRRKVRQSVNCYLQSESEVIITDLLVEEYGTVDGGILQGNIQNSGLIQNVTLAAGTIIEGGSIAGTIIGIPDNKAILTNVKIEAGTSLSNVVISSDVMFDPDSIGLGIGVLFEDNSLIPNGIRLEPILGYMPIAPIFERQVVILTTDVLYNGNRNGILGIMNALAESNAKKIKLGKMKQHSEYGYLYSYIGEKRYAILPMRVEHILRTQVNDLISQELIVGLDNKLTFITHLGRKIITQPVIQAPDFFNEELLALGLEPAIMLENGNIQVNTANSYFYQARASLTATITDNSLGLHTDNLPISLIFTDSNLKRQQFIYPTAADTETLDALPNTKLTYEGILTVQIENRTYTGLLDYVVTKGKSNKLSIQDIGDVNDDNCSDYQLNYPNGNSQIIFCTP